MPAPRDRAAERRTWQRLPLAIPVFVRGTDERGAEFLEFTTAFNISAGGMLVSIRRVLQRSTRVTVEIPAAPVPTMNVPPSAVRNVAARVVRVEEGPGWHLYGLRFTRPLLAL